MKQRTIGQTMVSAIGLGAMPLSIADHPDESQAIRTIHAALDVGVNFIDTADAYRPAIDDPSGNGHNERLIRKALAQYHGNKSSVQIATKAGNIKPFGDDWLVDASPGYLHRACEGSLRALGIDCIALYQLHRPDPKVPIEESVGALMNLRDAGKIKMIGLSNVRIDHIDRARRALGVRGLASVQNQFSPAYRKGEDVLSYCHEHAIAFLPWSPLGGVGNAGRLAGGGAFAETAARHGVSAQQVALAWLLAKGPCVIPIPGARRPETIVDSARAPDLELTDSEIAQLNRYPHAEG
jgi:aryl-alcohol dehydrogenase-like predicted oxidoreductase